MNIGVKSEHWELCKIVEARKERMKELLALEQVKLDQIILARRDPKNGGSGAGGGRPTKEEESKISQIHTEMARLRNNLLPGEVDSRVANSGGPGGPIGPLGTPPKAPWIPYI